MAEHTIEFTHTRQPTDKPEWAQCACGANSGWRLNRSGEGGTEEWAESHRAFVRRVRLSLSRRTPGLSDQRDYYQQMADNPNIPADERAQWKALAADLTSRIDGSDGSVQESLFD